MGTLLEIQELSIAYRSNKGRQIAVDQVSFSLAEGEALGLVGESGSGKSTVAAAVIGLLPANAEILSGRILFDGLDLLQTDPETLRGVRWKDIAIIFQAAMTALNPIQRVGDQIIEVIRYHEPKTSASEARRRVQELYTQMEIPLDRLDGYPHQYSGGMRQRAVIAMALACHPKLIIADEPTTALDVLVQKQILDTIAGFQKDGNLAVLFISHDIAVVSDVCCRIGVMQSGRLVEIGGCGQVFGSPCHSHTQSLINAHITLNNKETRPL